MKISLIAQNELVKDFVKRAILDMAAKNISREEKHLLNSDLVPRFSNKVAKSYVMDGPETFKKIEERRKNQVISPVSKVPLKSSVPPQIILPKPSPPHNLNQRQITSPLFQKETPLLKYGKITTLLGDPSVSAIECPGPGKQINVFRGGQRQITRITLNAEEIGSILKKFSEEAHVPLMEGVFRVIVDNFSINAVISEIVGSKFILKKSSPSGLPR